MVTNDAVFRAVSDPIRRRILTRLREGPLETGRIARAFPVSRPAISKHLRVLVGAGLLRRRRVGRRCLYALHAAPLEAVERWARTVGAKLR
jgi:DNA-binding transcriptional ArsR family regulator